MTTTASAPTTLAALEGTYTIDPSHSRIGFVARHAMVTKVRGSFEEYTGTAAIDGANPSASTLDVDIKAASINTRNADRDAHLRSADFFDVETYPTIDFVSTGVRYEGGDFLVDGVLTMHGVTKPVTFELEFGGFGTDQWGNFKAGATATTVVNREDFGLTWNAALETGGFLVADKVVLEFEVSAIKA